MFGDYLDNFENHHFLSQTAVATFWATFYSNIWPHCNTTQMENKTVSKRIPINKLCQYFRMSHITILNSYVLRKCRTNCSKSLAEAKAFVNLFLVLLGTSGHLSINSELLVSFIDCLKNWVFHSWPLFLYFRLFNTLESKKISEDWI